MDMSLRHDNYHPEPSSDEPPLVKLGQGDYEREYKPAKPKRLPLAVLFSIATAAFLPVPEEPRHD